MSTDETNTLEPWQRHCRDLREQAKDLLRRAEEIEESDPRAAQHMRNEAQGMAQTANDFFQIENGLMGVPKIGLKDRSELETICADDMDGCLWEDVVRIARTPGGGYVLRRSKTGRIVARFDLIDEALHEAQRRNRKRWR